MGPTSLLSAFATDTALVLAHAGIAGKSNEIPAAQTLFGRVRRHQRPAGHTRCAASSEIFGRCQTSQHCPDRPAKGQPADLHQQIGTIAATTAPLGSAHSHDTARSRDERRTVTVSGPAALASTDWEPHVAAIFQVEREVYTRISKSGLLRHSAETAFYVSSMPITAIRAAKPQTVCIPGRCAHGLLQLHRGLVRPNQAALGPGLLLTHGLRSQHANRRSRNVAHNSTNGPRNRGNPNPSRPPVGITPAGVVCCG